LLAGLFGVAVVATGLTSWAVATRLGTPWDAKAPMTVQQEADSLLQKGMLQDRGHDPKGAARSYARVLHLQPENKFAWFNLGVAAQEVGDTADARRAYEKTLTIDPAFAPALYNQALLLERTEPDQAAALLERTTAADPKAAAAHYHLGLIWSRKDSRHKAVQEFRRAVAIDPSLLSQVPRAFRDSVRGS
jgi:tetratricopeptide (TPR) repeat protein